MNRLTGILTSALTSAFIASSAAAGNAEEIAACEKGGYIPAEFSVTKDGATGTFYKADDPSIYQVFDAKDIHIGDNTLHQRIEDVRPFQHLDKSQFDVVKDLHQEMFGDQDITFEFSMPLNYYRQSRGFDSENIRNKINVKMGDQEYHSSQLADLHYNTGETGITMQLNSLDKSLSPTLHAAYKECENKNMHLTGEPIAEKPNPNFQEQQQSPQPAESQPLPQ